MKRNLNVAVVEDCDVQRTAVTLRLKQRGHNVQGLTCAEEMEDAGGSMSVDVLVSDVELPGEDGLSLAKRMRDAHPNAGIIVVTATPKIERRLGSYESGADLFLSKPLHLAELAAAVEAVGRRVLATRVPTDGGLVLSESALSVQGPGGTVSVSEREAHVLAALSRAPGRQLETWRLMEVLGEDPETYAKEAFEVRMGRLRRKLQQAGAEVPCLKALRGVGYQLCAPLLVV